MTKEASSFQRARSAAAKQERTVALLTSARALATKRGVRDVTLTDIAAAAGVHVSGVRRYFGSREEIFLRLASDEWVTWVEEVRAGLDGSHNVGAADLAALLSRTLAAQSLFCELLAHAPLSLEREVPTVPVRDYKLSALAAADVFTTAVTGATSMSAEQGVDLLAAVTSVASGLWQISHPPETLARLYVEDSRLAHAASDFTPRLTRLTAAFVQGLLIAPE